MAEARKAGKKGFDEEGRGEGYVEEVAVCGGVTEEEEVGNVLGEWSPAAR